MGEVFDNLLPDLTDTLEAIDNEERAVRLVGTVLHRAFCQDRKFRDHVRSLIALAAKCCAKTAATQQFHYQEYMNSYLCSAYHAACAVEELHKFAVEYHDDQYQFGFLTGVSQSLGPSIVFELYNAFDLLKLEAVRTSLGVSEIEIVSIFNRYPDLVEVRNSLAHQAERGMGYHYGRPIEPRDPSVHFQLHGQAGSHLVGFKNKYYEELSIKVSSASIMELVADLKELVLA